jgi:mlo protein
MLVGTKLQVIITKMGLRIQERGDVIKGTPVVQPGDDLFWFGRPRFLLFLIHFVLFQVQFISCINKLHNSLSGMLIVRTSSSY